MTLTKLIQESIAATTKYEAAKKDYEKNHHGEFNSHKLGERLNQEMLNANKELESHVNPTIETKNTDLFQHLTAVLTHAENQTCLHEETHRGGAIWEICDLCGTKWADDRGGKPKDAHEYPIVLKNAREFLSKI